MRVIIFDWLTENHLDVHWLIHFIEGTCTNLSAIKSHWSVTKWCKYICCSCHCPVANNSFSWFCFTCFRRQIVCIHHDEANLPLFSTKRDFYSLLLQLPPPPPPQLYCFSSTTTTIAYKLFSLNHHYHISIIFPLLHNHHVFIMLLPPPPPSPQLYCFPASMFTYCITS